MEDVRGGRPAVCVTQRERDERVCVCECVWGCNGRLSRSHTQVSVTQSTARPSYMPLRALIAFESSVIYNYTRAVKVYTRLLPRSIRPLFAACVCVCVCMYVSVCV